MDAVLLVESVVRSGVVEETSGETTAVLVSEFVVGETVGESAGDETTAVLVAVCSGDFDASSDSGTISCGKRPSCWDRSIY